MLWVKAFHIIAMVTWFSGIFYLPRLFVYHSMSEDRISQERFKIMERKLYYGIMTPGAIVTIALGLWLLQMYGWEVYKHMLWLHLKLGLVVGLIIYHLYCNYLRKRFARDANKYSHVFYRVLNEVPVVFLVFIVVLATVKPF